MYYTLSWQGEESSPVASPTTCGAFESLSWLIALQRVQIGLELKALIALPSLFGL